MDRDFQNGYDNRHPRPQTDAAHAFPENVIPLPARRHAPENILDMNDSISAIELFAFQLAAALTKDYGDWMRDANLYLWELHQYLKDESAVQDHLARLHYLIQYTPNWQPIQTCRDAIRIAIEMRGALNPEAANHESLKMDPQHFGVSLTESDVPEAN